MAESYIKNLDKLIIKLENLDNEEAIEKALEKAAQLVENSAKANAPVDTGRLRSSITHETKGLEAVVGTNVEYAAFVELGTSKQRPQPYLLPALAANREEIIQLLADAIKEEATK